MPPRSLPSPVHQAGHGLISAAAAMPDSSPGVSAAEAVAVPAPLVDNNRLHVVFGTGQVGRVLAALLAERGLIVRVVSRHRPAGLTARTDWRGADATGLYGATAGREGSPPVQRGAVAAAERTGALLVSLENLYGYGPTGGRPMTEDLPLAATTVKGRTRAAMTAELLAAAYAGRVRIAIGRASDFFGAGVTQGSTLGERVFGNALAGRRADFIGNPGLLHTYSYVPDIDADRGMVEAGAAHRRVHPGRLRRLLAGPREPGHRRPRRRRTDRGVRRRGDRRVHLRHQGHGRDRPPAGRPGGQADRAIGDPRHHHRAGRCLRAARHRHRGWSLRLGSPVHRDHDRAAAALPRPPRRHPPPPPGRLGADRRAGHPRRHDVRQVARRDHRLCRRGRAPGHRDRRFPRPRGPAICSLIEPGWAQREGPMLMHQADSHTASFRPFFNPATGEWITYTAIAEDSHGQLVRFNWRSVPGGVITEHIHPHQEERFTILAGEAPL